MTDEALMRRVQQGDRAAYDALYHRWTPRLFPFLHRRTGHRRLAEEALQETWLRVHRFRDRYDPEQAFKPWLYRIATNAGRDTWRRPRFDEFEPPEGDDGGALWGQLWVRDAILKSLHALDARDRRLYLLVVEGFSVAEAGRMVDLTPSTARTRIQRARARIQESLDVS